MVKAISHVYQVCYTLYKLELPYSAEQEAAVVDSFVQTEKELDFEINDETDGILTTASHIIESIFDGFDPKDILPRHGPGAVATGEKAEEKWNFKRFYNSLHQEFDYLRYFYHNGIDDLEESLSACLALEFWDSGTAQVVLVPKDSRGPRLISMEPLEYQFIQQGLGRAIVARLESHCWTKGHINFTDQSINRELALKSSLTKEFATLDLEAASDRVSLALVERLFQRCPALLAALKAARTTATVLPHKGPIQRSDILDLKKFAPMGSALCFPVEALCFWALAVAALVRKNESPLEAVCRDVYVYGDDILVRTEYARFTMRTLEQFALKVNANKSCVDGSFRESCGMDAFHGVQVTPVKIHRLFTDSYDPKCLAAWAAAANQLAAKGYNRAADFIFAKLRSRAKKFHWNIPYGTPDSPFISQHVSSATLAEELNWGLFQWRWNDDLQHLEFKVFTSLKNGDRKTLLNGPERMFRDLIQIPMRPDREPIPSSLKRREKWVPVVANLTTEERSLYA
jgi:hypothetical protein